VEGADTLELVLVLILGVLWNGDVSTFWMNKPMNWLAIDPEANSYTCSHCDIGNVVSDAGMPTVIKLKLSQDVAVCIECHSEIRGFLALVDAVQDHVEERCVLPSSLWGGGHRAVFG